MVLRDDGSVDFAADAPAAFDGSWKADAVAAGRKLKVRVKTAAGSAWYLDEEPFTVDAESVRRTIALESIRVTGSVRLAKKPLAAEVVFGTEHGGVSVPLQSDEAGRVEGALPRGGTWRVAVRAEGPRARRELDVDVTGGRSGEGRFEIVLSDRSLEGELVFEDGSAVPSAVLRVRRANSREFSSEPVEGGTFRISGLAPDRYVVSASGGGADSDDVAVVLGDDGAEPLRLVLKPRKSVRVRVVSPSRNPVIGATVWFLVDARHAAATTEGVVKRFTDASGRAAHIARPDAAQRCVAVQAAGFAARLLPVPADGSEQTVEVSSVSARLDLEYPEPTASAWALVSHAGCWVPAGFLERIGRGARGSAPNLAPGEYALCLFGAGSETPSDCRRVEVPAFGSSKLSLSAGR